MSDTTKVEIRDGVMIITINRPEAKNAINKSVAEGVAAALIELDSNPDIQVAVLQGAGGGFSSGMDLKAFLTGELPVVEGRGFAGLTEAVVEKPLIAAVEGFALAGGFEIMLSCDLVIAASNAKLGIPEVKRGLVAAGGGLVKMPRQMPKRLAMEMALTGNSISADRAYDIGLINKVVEPGAALDAAMELANTIKANGPMAVKLSKQVINSTTDWTSDSMMQKQLEIVTPIFTSNDAREGPTAFAEKRAPKWTGT
ncbi:MAG: enoyl-CoA hydratase [Cryomorphaceae bacterium]|jgi:enoyl-CoA hydratase